MIPAFGGWLIHYLWWWVELRAFPSSLVFLVSISVNLRVNGTGLAAKTLVILCKEGVRGMGAAWGWLCHSGGGENFVVVGCGR